MTMDDDLKKPWNYNATTKRFMNHSRNFIYNYVLFSIKNILNETGTTQLRKAKQKLSHLPNQVLTQMTPSQLTLRQVCGTSSHSMRPNPKHLVLMNELKHNSKHHQNLENYSTFFYEQ